MGFSAVHVAGLRDTPVSNLKTSVGTHLQEPENGLLGRAGEELPGGQKGAQELLDHAEVQFSVNIVEKEDRRTPDFVPVNLNLRELQQQCQGLDFTAREELRGRHAARRNF